MGCCCFRASDDSCQTEIPDGEEERGGDGRREYLRWTDIDTTGTRGNRIGVGSYGVITKYIIGDDNVVAAVKDMWLFQDDVRPESLAAEPGNFVASSDADARRKRDMSKRVIVSGETLRELALVRNIPRDDPSRMLVGALFYGLTPCGVARMAMPFVDGCGSFCHFNGTTLERKQKWVRRMFACVAHAHELGIVHGDIKPENFLLDTATDDLLLADFGLAASVGVPPCRRRDNLYAVHFRPPEFFGCESCDVLDIERGDVWACGASACVVFDEGYPRWAHGAERAYKNLDMMDGRAVARAEKAAGSAVFRGIARYFGLPTEETWPRANRPPSLRSALDQLANEAAPSAPAKSEVRPASAPLSEDDANRSANFKAAMPRGASAVIEESSDSAPAWVLLVADGAPAGVVTALKRAMCFDPARRPSASEIVEILALASADPKFPYSSPRRNSLSRNSLLERPISFAKNSETGVLADLAFVGLESRIAASAYSAYARAVVAHAEWIWDSLELTFSELMERPRRACAVDAVLALATARLAYGRKFSSPTMSLANDDAERLAAHFAMGAWLVWDAATTAHPLRAYRYAKIAASQLLFRYDDQSTEDKYVIVGDGGKEIETDVGDGAEARLRKQLAKIAYDCLFDLDFRVARPTPRACAVSLAHASLLPAYSALVDSSVDELAQASICIQCDRALVARYIPSQLGAAIMEDFLRDSVAAKMFSAENGHRGQFLMYAQGYLRASNQWTAGAGALTPDDRDFIRRRRGGSGDG